MFQCYGCQGGSMCQCHGCQIFTASMTWMLRSKISGKDGEIVAGIEAQELLP